MNCGSALTRTTKCSGTCGTSNPFRKHKTTLSLCGAVGEVIHCAFHSPLRASGGSWAHAHFPKAARRARQSTTTDLTFMIQHCTELADAQATPGSTPGPQPIQPFCFRQSPRNLHTHAPP